MSDVVIKIENLSKQYRLGLVGTQTLKGDLQRFWWNLRGKGDPTLKIGQENSLSQVGGEYVWALKDINLEVKQGEILGIIGKNGAGKSTLLKILSRVTSPTSGSIKVQGRIASLLEVGTGFHGELTGRENIYLNGAILGMTKAEINSKLDEIIDFAGIAKYIDTPVKRYSSGMYVRLGFAVAAHLDPEILIVDEVLAVGDAEFQKKAIGKMQDISKGEGRTVLFVSHNMASVERLCASSVLLSNGSINFSGNTSEVINYYIESFKSNENKDLIFETTSSFNLAQIKQNNNNSGMISAKVFCNDVPTNILSTGDNLKIEIEIINDFSIEDMVFGYVIKDENNHEIFAIHNKNIGIKLNILPVKKATVVIDINQFPIIREGFYWFDFYLGDKMNNFDIIKKAISIYVKKTDIYNSGIPMNDKINVFYFQGINFYLKNAQ